MPTSPNPLKAFSTDELLEEIVRRRNVRERRPVESWCDECAHFKTAPKGAADDYNPCQRGHRMAFWMPQEHEGPAGVFGYYRRVCADRTAA